MVATALVAACLAAAAGLCGCAVIGEQYVLEGQFDEEQARAIRHGETTKKDVLHRFGPPSAVARKGAPAGFPPRGPGDGQVVYRYDASEFAMSEFCAYGQYGGGCIPGTPVLKRRTLWILVDEGTGLVADHKVEASEAPDNTAVISPWLGP